MEAKTTLRERCKADLLSLLEKKNIPKELNKYHRKVMRFVVAIPINKTVSTEMRGKWGS